MMRRTLIAVMLCSLAVQSRAITGGATPCRCPTQWDAVGALGFAYRLGQEPERKGATDHDWHCAATLAAPQVIVTARHCVHDFQGERFALRLRRALDGALGRIEDGPASFYHARVVAWHFPDCGDVALGYLAEPVPHVAPVPVLFDAGLSVGHSITLGAWGREGPQIGQGPKRRLNLCETVVSFVAPCCVNMPPAPEPGEAGCGVNANDSGGAIVEQRDGDLRLIAVITGTAHGAHLGFCADDPNVAALAMPWPSDDARVLWTDR